MPVIEPSSPSAPDFEPASECRFSVATTSAIVIGRPSWKVTPLRILKVQVTASSEASQDSARAGTGWPVSGSVSTSMSPQLRQVTKVNCERFLPGSRESVADAPSRPSFRWPPRLGSCAFAAVWNIVPAAASVMPKAAARPMNSRRLMRPSATWLVRYFV